MLAAEGRRVRGDRRDGPDGAPCAAEAPRDIAGHHIQSGDNPVDPASPEVSA